MKEKITIVRARRKTMCLTLGREGEVIVRAPRGVSREQIASFVERHESWIERRRAERERVPRFAIGGEVTLFGKRYLLAEGKPSVSENTVYLPRVNFEPAFERTLKRMAFAYLTELTERVAERYGFSYSSVRISSARTRWGSCNAKGNINYTFRMAFLPEDVILYVVVHELCHTRRLDHGSAFWQEVKTVLPDYAVRRAKLKNCSLYMQTFPEKSS